MEKTRALLHFSRFSAVLAFAVGLLVLSGWYLGVERLTHLFPGMASMKPNASVGFMVLAIALYLGAEEGRRPKLARPRLLFACAAMLLGAITVSQDFFGWDLRLDGLLLETERERGMTGSPGRMAPGTAICFALLGGALMALGAETRRGHRPAEYLALAAGVISFLSCLGYLYGEEALYGIGVYNSMSLHTAGTLFLLWIAVLCTRPDRGWMATVTSVGADGVMARRLLAVALFMPPALGWLRLVGQKKGYFDLEFGLAAMVSAITIILSGFILATARVLGRQEADLRASERRLTISNQAALIGTFEWDLRTHRIIWTPELERLHGMREGEFDGRLGRWMESVHPEDRERVAAEMERAAETSSRLETEYRIVRSDGGVRWIAAAAQVLAAPDASRRMIGVNMDVTEKKEVAESIRRYSMELERSNQDLQEFAAVASHDLQEPLRKIVAFGDRLRARVGATLDEQSQDYLARMEAAAARMASLIESLLHLSRVTTRAQPFQATDLRQVVEEALADLEERIRQTGGRVEVKELPVLKADRQQLRQLFQNLIANGLKFHERGRPPVVGVRASRGQHGFWQIVVEDNGIGFDEKYLDRLFKPFQRLHGRDQYDGSGMGLAICRKIAARHGGSITARSTPGSGSSFIVSLPEQPTAAPRT